MPWMTNRLIREMGGSAAVATRTEGGTQITVTIPTRPVMEPAELGNVA